MPFATRTSPVQRSMPSRAFSSLCLGASLLLCLAFGAGTVSAAQATPAVGAHAPDFTLSTPEGKPVPLASLDKGKRTILIVLRGFPGYQCPYCVKQVHDFEEHAGEFAARNANVLLVYPGPPADLDAHAKEFLAKQQAAMPANVFLVLDPGYQVTNLYGLRWDAPHETAYPSTFVLAPGGTILFEKVSRAHGDRTSAVDVLAQLPAQ